MRMLAFVILFVMSSCFSEDAVKPPAPPPEVVKEHESAATDKPAVKPTAEKKAPKNVAEKKKSSKELQADEAAAIIQAMKADPIWDALTGEQTARIQVTVGSLVKYKIKFDDATWSQLSLGEKILIRNHAPTYLP